TAACDGSASSHSVNSSQSSNRGSRWRASQSIAALRGSGPCSAIVFILQRRNRSVGPLNILFHRAEAEVIAFRNGTLAQPVDAKKKEYLLDAGAARRKAAPRAGDF